MAELNAQQKQMAKIIAKTWADDEYKQRFISDPAAVLKEEGADVPAGMTFEVLEATADKAYLVLPPKPADADVIDGAEERLASSICCGCYGMCFNCIGCV